MTSPDSKKFIVMYLIPTAVMDDWKKIDPEKRKADEEKLMGEWSAWTKDHAKMILDTNAGGKTKLVTASGVSDFQERHHPIFDRGGRIARRGGETPRKPSASANSAIVHSGHGNQADGRDVAAREGSRSARGLACLGVAGGAGARPVVARRVAAISADGLDGSAHDAGAGRELLRGRQEEAQGEASPLPSPITGEGGPAKRGRMRVRGRVSSLGRGAPHPTSAYARATLLPQVGEGERAAPTRTARRVAEHGVDLAGVAGQQVERLLRRRDRCDWFRRADPRSCADNGRSCRGSPGRTCSGGGFPPASGGPCTV